MSANENEPTPNALDWEQHWADGNAFWDRGKPSPALISLFETEDTRSLIPEHGRALVPGCGLGYDVVFLAKKIGRATGLDLSATCVQLLNKNHPDAKDYDFICGDFFKFDSPAEGYDLAYDYTFLCALLPVLRPRWAARYGEIIKSGGILITLIFPIGDHTDGPPFAVSEQLYEDLLSPNFELLSIKKSEGHIERKDREKIAIWKRK